MKWLFSDGIVTSIAIGLFVWAGITVVAYFIADSISSNVLYKAIDADANDAAKMANKIRAEVLSKGNKIGAIVGGLVALVLISVGAFN